MTTLLTGRPAAPFCCLLCVVLSDGDWMMFESQELLGGKSIESNRIGQHARFIRLMLLLIR